MNFKIFQLIIISIIFSQELILSLNDCIDISIKNKISMKMNEFNLEYSKELLKESYGNILPSINFNGNIIAVDCDKLSVGFLLGDIPYVVPKASDKNFISKVFDIVKNENKIVKIPVFFSEASPAAGQRG